MCQPGRPLPHGLSQKGSPGFAAFHSAKSSGLFREVERALLALVDLDARAGVELFEALLRELAVLGEARHAEVDVAVRFIGVALFDKLLDDVDDCVDFVRRARVDGRAADAERVGVGVVFGDVFLRELGDGDAHLVRAVYHLVVDVGEVLHVGDFVA